MEKIKFRSIESEHELELFIDKIENFTKVRLPLAYVNNSKVVGAFLQGSLVGGYMLVTKPQFRSLLFVPEHIKNSIEFFRKDTYEMLEVNGVWMGPAIKTTKMQFYFWMKLLSDIFFARKKYLLLMSNSKNMIIEYLHSLAKSKILYEGPPNLMVGDSSHDVIRVGYTTRIQVILNIPKYWMEIQDRERRVQVFNQQRMRAKPLGLNVDYGSPNAAQ